MTVILLTQAQAIKLFIRLDGWYGIMPIPLKNGKWYIKASSKAGIKEKIIDTVKNKPSLKSRAIIIWNAIKDLPVYETDEIDKYEEQLYNTDPATQEGLEYAARLEELEFEDVI